MAIRYTHGYDLLFKVGAMIGGLVIVSAGTNILEPIFEPLGRTLRNNDLNWVWLLLGFVYFIGAFVGAITLLSKTVMPIWLPTYLYVRFSLSAKITPDEAKRLSFLFDGSLSGTWYPLRSILKIDREYRRETLFRFANKIASVNGWRRPFSMPEDMAGQQHKQSQQRSDQSAHAGSSSERQPTIDTKLIICLEVLGLSMPPPSFDAIKLAYRRKIKEFHPDKFSGEKQEVIQHAEEMSKRLNAAYAYLESNLAKPGL